MTTYYAAQLGISLSVVDSKASYKDMLRSQNSKTDEDSRSRSPSPEYESSQNDSSKKLISGRQKVKPSSTTLTSRNPRVESH